MTTTAFKFMKSELIVIIYLVLITTSISILSINTNLTNAVVICIDKYNQTNLIPCSDQNAIVRTNSQQANTNNTLSNATTNTNPKSNTTNLMPDVKVVSQQSQRTAGFIFLIHYIVFGNVANFGNATSGSITVHLQITSPQGAVLYSTDGSTIPGTLAPKQEGKFTFEFTSDDLGGYKSGDWTFDVSVVKQ
jgi:hypothetical protein